MLRVCCFTWVSSFVRLHACVHLFSCSLCVVALSGSYLTLYLPCFDRGSWLLFCLFVFLFVFFFFVCFFLFVLAFPLGVIGRLYSCTPGKEILGLPWDRNSYPTHVILPRVS